MTDPRIQEALEAAENLAGTYYLLCLGQVDRATMDKVHGETQTKLAAAKEALQSPEGDWQPIDSAPKDGTRFLFHAHRIKRTLVAWFESPTVLRYEVARGDERWIENPEKINPPPTWTDLPTPPESDRND